MKVGKLDLYASGLIAEMRRSWVTEKSKVNSDDFLVSYKPLVTKPKKELTEQEKHDHATAQLAIEKAHWAVMSGKTAKKAKLPHRPKAR